MSNIDDQIKLLQLKKKKIEFLTHILESTKSYKDKELNKDVKQDVINSLSTYVKNQIMIIETGKESKQLNTEFSNNEVNILKTVANKVLQKDSTIKNKPIQRQKVEMQNHNDKLSFALDNRHLAGKQVSVANDKNMVVKGEVTGLDSPFVVVKTDTGPIIKVPLENISLI